MAFVADAESERILQQYLAPQSPADGSVTRGGIAKAIKHLNRERSPNVLIVDLSGVDMPVSQVDILASVCEPGVTVIAIGDRDEIGLYRDLLHAGVTDYLIKPLTPQLLAKSLQRSANAEATGQISQKLAKMVAFIGARGGVGTTTLAANLAWYLAERHSRRVVLVDLDLQHGDSALALNVRPASGLRDALNNPLRVDATLLERAMTSCGERLFVLSSEEPLSDEVRVTPDAIEAIVSVLRPLFHYLIVDVPRIPSPAYRRALKIADLRIIVADQTLHSVRDAVRLRTLLSDGDGDDGGDRDGELRNLLVVNRSGEGGRDAVSLSEITNIVELQPESVIAFQPKLFARAAIDGRLPAAQGGSFADAIAALASGLSGRAPERRRFWGLERWGFKR
ncbi:MAG: AAA family ATPase [Stellaceae bacterium]